VSRSKAACRPCGAAASFDTGWRPAGALRFAVVPPFFAVPGPLETGRPAAGLAAEPPAFGLPLVSGRTLSLAADLAPAPGLDFAVFFIGLDVFDLRGFDALRALVAALLRAIPGSSPQLFHRRERVPRASYRESWKGIKEAPWRLADRDPRTAIGEQATGRRDLSGVVRRTREARRRSRTAG